MTADCTKEEMDLSLKEIITFKNSANVCPFGRDDIVEKEALLWISQIKAIPGRLFVGYRIYNLHSNLIQRLER